MARQILPLAGQIIGGMIGGPVGAAIGGAIGSVVGNAIDPQIIKGPKLGDGQVQTSAEGVYRPIVLGTGAVMGNIIHRGPEVVRTHRQRQSKGGGPKTEEQRRYRTFAIRVAEGPIAGILRIWMDEKLVYDIRPESTIPAESNDFEGRFRLYLGGEDQLPDPDLEAYMGIGNVNAYRGTAYVVFPNFDLTDYGDRIPQFRFEVSTTIGMPTWDGGWTAINPTGFDGGHQIGMMIWSDRWQRWLVAKGIGRRISHDEGHTWDSYGTALYFNVAENPNNNDIVWIDTSGNVYRSTDGGQTVSHVASEAYLSPNGSQLRFVDGFFYGLGSNRGYRINPVTFDVVEGDVIDGIGSNPRYIRIPGVGFFATGQHSNSRVFRSNNGLTNWVQVSTVGAMINDIEFDPVHNSVIVACQYGVIKASFDHCQSWGDPYHSHNGINYYFAQFVDGLRAVYVTGNGSQFQNNIITYDGGNSFIELPNRTAGTWIGLAVRDAPEKMMGFSSTNIFNANIVQDESSQALGDVVGFLHSRVGADRLDVAQLSDPVDGIVLSGDYTSADCIRTLMSVYMFDASEHDAGSGYRINYVKRGGPVVATITADDLVDEPEESVREDALERPKKLHLHFQSPTVGYAPAKATSMRNSPDVLVTGEVSASVPVVFGDVDEAWQRAGVMHQVAWAEVAGTQELVLSDAWLELVPTDNIGLVLRDQQRRLRITKIEHVEGTLKCDLMTDRQSSYTSSLTGIPLPEPTPPPPSIVGQTVFAFLDIPALTDAGDRLLYYVGVSGQTPAWYGAVIQRSMDGGANYEDVLTVGVNTIMGTLLDQVSSASEHYTDTTNVVRVQLFTDDEIQSLTQQQFLSEGGAFALEKPGGGWEVLQYRDADDEGDGVFALTTLLRGRLNSGPSEHLTGARFVLLDGVYAIDAETAMIGQDLTHRAVSLGTSPELGPVSTDTYTAQSQTEWHVAHILGEIDGTSLPVQIVPRHRFGTEDHPVRSVNWTGCRLTATDGSNSAAATVTGESHTFSVSGWSTPITVTASQLNRFTGAGPSVSEEFE